MVFHRGQKVEIYRKSNDDSWETYMDAYVGRHGMITDPDALVEVSIEGKGTHRLPQDCLRLIE